MTKDQALILLRDILARELGNYMITAPARSMFAHDAVPELIADIKFEGDSNEFWYDLLQTADPKQAIGKIIEKALSEAYIKKAEARGELLKAELNYYLARIHLDKEKLEKIYLKSRGFLPADNRIVLLDYMITVIDHLWDLSTKIVVSEYIPIIEFGYRISKTQNEPLARELKDWCRRVLCLLFNVTLERVNNILQRLEAEIKEEAGNDIISFDLPMDFQEPIKVTWPPLWRTTRFEEILTVRNWCKRVQLKFNPFGPEQAELDADLSEHSVYPAVFDQCLRDRRATIISGDPGSGKTTCAYLLAHACIFPELSPSEPSTYPILCTLSDNLDFQALSHNFSKTLADMFTRSLISFFARNVFHFLRLERRNKLAIASCLLYSSNSFENIQSRFWIEGMQDNRDSKQLLAQLYEFVREVQNTTFDMEGWLQIFSAACPKDFERIYLIIDVAGTCTAENTFLTDYLQKLINYWTAANSGNVYLKMILPTALRFRLKIPKHIVVCSLGWSEKKMLELLSGRVCNMEGYRLNFNELFDHNSKQYDPAAVIVKAAQGSPQRLIRIGNRLLEEHTQQSSVPVELSYHSLMAAIAHIANE